jgi:rubrerythrin
MGMSREKAGMQAIEGLVQIEETLFGIYRVFAERFPAHRDMWSRMAEEEEGHAKWIRDLCGQMEQGTVRLGADPFRVEGIQTFLDYASDRLEEAQAAKLPFLHALDMALDLESGLLEREFYKIFEADSEALEQAFEDMQQQIRDHTERIRKALAHEGGLS